MSVLKRPALFLDRDGVINVDRGFVARREDFVWQDGIFDLVREARARGYVPVIVTNQSGIGRGLYTSEDYETLNRWMLSELDRQGASIARVYHCPFHPEAIVPELKAVHPWRKPAPGMLLAAAADLNLDLARSILVGDRWSDIGAGIAAGVGSIILVGPAEIPAAPTADTAAAPVRCHSIREVVRWLEAQPHPALADG